MARKTVAALLLAMAVYLTVGVVRPAPPDPGLPVVVAAVDLPVGAELTERSIRTVHLPAEVVPRGALTQPHDAVGSVLAAPLRAGEVVTDLRLSPAAALAGLDADLVLAHLPLTDPQLSQVLGPGVRVDVLGTLDGGVLARDVLIVQQAPGDGEGPGFLVAVTSEQAGRLAASTGGEFPGDGVTVVIRP